MIILACFEAIVGLVWACHCLTKRDMFECQYVCSNMLTCDGFSCVQWPLHGLLFFVSLIIK